MVGIEGEVCAGFRERGTLVQGLQGFERRSQGFEHVLARFRDL